MPDDHVIATALDPDGRVVVLLARIWEPKIIRARPELLEYRDAVVATVSSPDHFAPDPRDERLRYYRSHVGPSRWLVVVVSYEQDPARIITAFASRKDPPTWTP
jgi:hypothetical protein